jgi:hypothetical protein
MKDLGSEKKISIAGIIIPAIIAIIIPLYFPEGSLQSKKEQQNEQHAQPIPPLNDSTDKTSQGQSTLSAEPQRSAGAASNENAISSAKPHRKVYPLAENPKIDESVSQRPNPTFPTQEEPKSQASKNENPIDIECYEVYNINNATVKYYYDQTSDANPRGTIEVGVKIIKKGSSVDGTMLKFKSVDGKTNGWIAREKVRECQ